MNNFLNIQELQQRAEDVSRELSNTREVIKQLKEKKATIFAEIGRLREEKSRLLEDLRSIKNNLRGLKEERRKLIDEYKKIIEERRNEIYQIKALRDLINTKSAELQGLSKEINIPISVIKQKIDEIEWTIQTNVLTPEQENELIRKLKGYTTLLNKALVVKKSKEEVLELRALYISTRTKVKELTDKADRLRELINSKTKEIEKLKKKLDEIVSKYMTTKSTLETKKRELSLCSNEIIMLTSKLNALRESYQELIKEIERAKSMEALSRKKATISREVEQRSKRRLTLDEYKIIYGNVEDLEEN